MYEDLQKECWIDLHLTWVLSCSIPTLILWGFIVPAYATYYLYKN